MGWLAAAGLGLSAASALGAFGGGGDKSSGGFQKIPDTKEQTWARQYLMGLAKDNVQFPTRPTAGIAPNEATAQSMLGNYYRQGTPGYNASIGQISRTASGQYNPATSDAYKGYRKQSVLEENAAVNAVRQRAQKVGMSASTPALKVEGTVRNQASANRQSMLGGLINAERDRSLGAAGMGITADSAAYSNLAATQPMAATPRMIETDAGNAEYESLLNSLLFKYNTQAGIAGQILGEPRYAYEQPLYTPSAFSQVGGAALQGLGAYYGAKAG